MPEPDRIFVLGSPRSGTSALSRALRRIFGLRGSEEGHVLPVFTGILHTFHAHSTRFREHPYLLASRLDTDHFRRHILEYVRSLYQEAHGGEGFVDKTPGADSIVAAQLIKEAFPRSRIIMLRRNGIGYSCSFSRKFNVGIDAAAQSWAICMKAIEIARESCGDFLEVDHSELLLDRGDTSLEIARHLGRPECGEFLAAALTRARTEASAEDEAALVRAPSRLSDVCWTNLEKRQFRETCGPFMAKFGYSL